MAGGLYGGIKFSTPNSGVSSSEATIITPIEPPTAAAAVQPAQIATDVPAPAPAPAPSDSAPAKADDSQKKSAGWSAALSFAPTRRKAPATQSRPTYVGFATVSTITPAATISPSAVISAPPVILQPPKPDVQPEAGDNGNAGGWGKKIKAPSMVLDEDINGFRAAGGKRKGGSRKKVLFSPTSSLPPAPRLVLFAG
ncbi:hypothetical protein FRC10_008310 [Ceratobasidium sp. 414]|nr:hypothetical protein FRC10_008310 [Ceratobasidium sp. 414]